MYGCIFVSIVATLYGSIFYVLRFSCGSLSSEMRNISLPNTSLFKRFYSDCQNPCLYWISKTSKIYVLRFSCGSPLLHPLFRLT